MIKTRIAAARAFVTDNKDDLVALGVASATLAASSYILVKLNNGKDSDAPVETDQP